MEAVPASSTFAGATGAEAVVVDAAISPDVELVVTAAVVAGDCGAMASEPAAPPQDDTRPLKRVRRTRITIIAGKVDGRVFMLALPSVYLVNRRVELEKAECIVVIRGPGIGTRTICIREAGHHSLWVIPVDAAFIGMH